MMYEGAMEYRQLGQSGLMVSALSLGTMTFGGRTIFSKIGTTDVAGARRQVDCPCPPTNAVCAAYASILLPARRSVAAG